MTTTRILSCEVYGHIGREIRAARHRRGMTQAELGACVELTRASLNNIEAGRQRLTIQMLYDIASILGVDPCSLLPRARP
ncbi:MAG TPA: helix-turn-helix transcriptional regulator [Chloroflexota bacterium]|nr:helix-turn-helix transcriptional regulator [Chloroflexota bacterium]